MFQGGRRIYVNRESRGGYQDVTTDVTVETREGTRILKQHLAAFRQECEDREDGCQPSVQVSCSLFV